MIIAILEKNPNSALDYTVDWSPWLPTGRTITTALLTVPSGITKASEANTTTTHSFRLDDGSDWTDYEIVTRVTLDNGQIDQRSLIIQVRLVEAVPAVDAADRAKALTQLLQWVQKDVSPPLTVDNIVSILNQHKAASTWAPNTSYTVGQKLLPPVRNGWWYEVVQPGTSQSGTRVFADWPTRFGQRLIDGTSDPQLILEVAGEDSAFRAIYSDPLSINVYDVRGAARECIQLRLQLGSQMVDESGVSFDQVTQHLEGLLKRFYPIRFPIRVVRA